MGMNWAEHSVEIAAPIETCFEAITDYESFPSWQNAIDSIAVKTRTPDGLGEDVQLFVDAKVRKIDYTLRYRYARPTGIEWDFISGNGMSGMDGSYEFTELGPERTRARYNLGADADLPIPGIVVRRTHKSLVKRSVEDLKREAERRFAVAGPPSPAAQAPVQAYAEPASERSEEPPMAAAGGHATGTAQEPWRPKAARDLPPPSARPDGSITDVPGAVAAKGLEVAGEAARSGIDVAERATKRGLRIAEDLATRVERLAGRR
jgi:ribosome-associated toxin RatA of RatAB toxin-antitoxin module